MNCMMDSRYIKEFVIGHGIDFNTSRRNLEAFARANTQWAQIASDLQIDENSVLLFCGAKNNGKSSLIRYLMNRYTRRRDDKDYHDRVRDMDDDDNVQQDSPRHAYFMDFDPGQPEMTTPGVVSCHIISSSDPPLSTPTYTNVLQYQPLIISSVGGTNMSVNPKMYIENCRYVFNQMKKHRAENNYPVFINTMGFIRNVGLAMLMDLIKICCPTNLITLNVENSPMRVIYADLSSNYMKRVKASFFYESEDDFNKLKLDYKNNIYNLSFSFVDSASMSTKIRTALQLAYFGSMPEALYKPLLQLRKKWLNLEKVSISCVSSYPLKMNIILDLLHLSWVHLVKLVKPVGQKTLQQKNEMQLTPDQLTCNILDEVRANFMFGCAIVVDIDVERKRFGLITPVAEDILDHQVDCIIKTLSIQVPREIMQVST